jgi:uroporphyrinogen decarboxylase
MNTISRTVLESPRRLAWPIATYPGAALAGVNTRAMATSADAQASAVAALHSRYRLPVVMTPMDLSVEAEAFGCPVRFADDEVPTVTAPVVRERAAVERLAVPGPGDGRTSVVLSAVPQLKKLPGSPRVLGGMIGPFSLAARLFGVTETLELTIADAGLAHALLDVATRFLVAYAEALREAGADGVIVAEPVAGLLSPRSLRVFSSEYVRRLASLAGERFALVLHNCAARRVHLSAIVESGATMYHFGAPMDVVAALGEVPAETVLWGNLDPTVTFCQLECAGVAAQVARLLEATRAHPNFVLSSGCDVPPNARLENLDAFHAAIPG